MKSARKKPAKSGGQRDLASTRLRILKAAALEFARKGLEGARIDRIATRSRANKAMIYYIFGNKNALHLAVLENLFEEKTRNLDHQVLENAPSVQDLLSLLSTYLDAFLNNPDATRMIIHDMAAGAKTLKRLKKKRPDLFQPFLDVSSQITVLAKQGKVQSLDADKAVLTTMLVLMAVPIFLPYADLIHPKEDPRHKKLTDLELWKNFLAEVFSRTLL